MNNVQKIKTPITKMTGTRRTALPSSTGHSGGPTPWPVPRIVQSERELQTTELQTTELQTTELAEPDEFETTTDPETAPPAPSSEDVGHNLFTLSPVEDALLRETFMGRFTF